MIFYFPFSPRPGFNIYICLNKCRHYASVNFKMLYGLLGFHAFNSKYLTYEKITIYFLVAVLLAACGDSRPDDLPVSKNATVSKSYEILASAGSSSELEVTFTINDFTAIKEYVKWIKKAEIQTNSFIEVSGITAGQEVELKNVELWLKRDSKKRLSLSTISENGKIEENILTQLNFLQSLMDEIVRRGESTVVLKYVSTHTMDSSVFLKLSLDSRFTF